MTVKKANNIPFGKKRASWARKRGKEGASKNWQALGAAVEEVERSRRSRRPDEEVLTVERDAVHPSLKQ